MGLDDGKQKCHCFCNKSSKNCEDFQKVLGVRNADRDLVIYRHMYRTEDINMNTEVLDTRKNATKDVIILHNSKDVEIGSDEIGSELEQNTVSCPQCRQLLQHAQRLLHKLSTVDKKVTVGICDHCKTKVQFRKSRNEYEEIVKRFVTNKGDLIEESKQRVNIWLSKVKYLLKDVITEVDQSRKIRSRTFSDPYIDRLSKLPSRVTAPEPEIKQMFYPTMHRSDRARKYSQETLSTLKFKELSEGPDFLKRQRKQSLKFNLNISQSEHRRVKTSDVEKLITGIRKYNSDEALHIAISHESIPKNDFSYYFPKPDNARQSFEHQISSSELIKNTQDILRNKANEDKVKQEEEERERRVLEDTIVAHEQIAGEKNKAKKSHIELTKDNFEQTTLAAGEKRNSNMQENEMLVMKDNKIVENEENQFENGKEKRKFPGALKDKLGDADMKHPNDDEKNITEWKKQKTEQLTEQSTRAEKKKLSEKEIKGVEGRETTKSVKGEKKNLTDRKSQNIVEKTKLSVKEAKGVIEGETQKLKGRETTKPTKGETKKPTERETKNIGDKTTNLVEKTALLDGMGKKRTVEEEKNKFKDGKKTGLLENVKKKQVEENNHGVDEKNKYVNKNRAKEDYTSSTQVDKKMFVEKGTKRQFTDQDHLNDKKTSKPTEIDIKTIMNGKSGVKSNITAKKSNEPATKDIHQTEPNDNNVYVQKTKEKELPDKNNENNSKVAEKKHQGREDVIKRKGEETSDSKYKEQDPMKHKNHIVDVQTINSEKKKTLSHKVTNEKELPAINTKSITNKKEKDYAENELNRTKEKPEVHSGQEQSSKLNNIIQQLPTTKELRIDQIKVRKLSQNDISFKFKQDNINKAMLKNPMRLSQISALKIKEHKFHKTSKTWSFDSDFELDMESAVYKKDKPFELANIIIGPKLFKYKPLFEKKKIELEEIPVIHKTEFKDDLILIEKKKDILDTIPEEVVRKPPLLQTKGTKSIEMSKNKKVDTDQEIPKGIVRYALSDRTFIDKGWTMLPTEKVVRKMNVYRMRPVHPEFDWFEHNRDKRLMHYDTGEKLAEFDDNGRGRWYYRNGRLALDYYDAEELNAQQRFVVYSSGEPDERGRSHPITILATFDYLGNGIVFDHSGKLRLKYNQTEGVVLDREIGPVSHWKWHSLNDPPVLQQVMIDTQIAHKVPEILKLGGPSDRKARPDNEEMLAIEFDNFINEKSKKITQTFKPFQIKMKALKINEHFSLRVLDQTTIYLIFRDGSTNIKLNIGMLLDHKEIVDTDTAEVGDVSNNLERFPARTDSLAGMQRRVAYAQRVEHCRMEREQRLRPPVPCRSVDRLTAPTSRPLRPPIRTVPSGSTTATGECYCRLNRKPSLNLYYDTRFV